MNVSKVRESFELYEEFEEKPIAEIIFACGFFMIYIIEEIASFFGHKHIHSVQKQGNTNG